jgi:hypothetical protein
MIEYDETDKAMTESTDNQLALLGVGMSLRGALNVAFLQGARFAIQGVAKDLIEPKKNKKTKKEKTV